MIVLPSKGVIVVSTPRTGSRAMEEALRSAKLPGTTITKQHHHPAHLVEHAKKSSGYEVWGIIRHPLAQLGSWMAHNQMRGDPKEYIQKHRHPLFMSSGGMNIYNQQIDRYFVYEDNAHRKLLDALGLEDVEIPEIGKTGGGEREFSAAEIYLAKKRFKLDFELYEEIAGHGV